LYLSLTCYYFKLKLSYLNRQINECESTRDAFTLMKQLNALHFEIHTCNSQFWSTYIAQFLYQIVFMINFTLYIALFMNFNYVFSFIYLFFACNFFAIFSVIILGPSFVAFEACISYQKFHKLYIRLNRKRKLSILQGMKVINNFRLYW